MKRAVVLCPGRGSYAKAQLGSLADVDTDAGAAELVAAIDATDRARKAAGDLTIRGMDAADRFSSALLQGHNAAPLIFAVTAHEMLKLDPDRVEVVAVGGNSMGWYSALWAAGALGLSDAFRLVETMGGMTRDGTIGGQLIYPVVDDTWRADPATTQMVEKALAQVAEAGLEAGDSIRFGGYRVLWGEEAALEQIAATLLPREIGGARYPLRLLGNSAFHSHLMVDAARRGSAALADLPIGAPRVPLIDGRGRQWRPLTAAPAALLDYTLGHQVTRTFDFCATVRVAIREYAPDVIVALGPGESLGGAIAQVLIDERWQGLASREDFLRRQAANPIVISLARPAQAEQVARPV
jgi:acyl transferase domain-containing protein